MTISAHQQPIRTTVRFFGPYILSIWPSTKCHAWGRNTQSLTGNGATRKNNGTRANHEVFFVRAFAGASTGNLEDVLSACRFNLPTDRTERGEDRRAAQASGIKGRSSSRSTLITLRRAGYLVKQEGRVMPATEQLQLSVNGGAACARPARACPSGARTPARVRSESRTPRTSGVMPKLKLSAGQREGERVTKLGEHRKPGSSHGDETLLVGEKPASGRVAQLGEHRLCKPGVVGSIPTVSTCELFERRNPSRCSGPHQKVAQVVTARRDEHLLRGREVRSSRQAHNLDIVGSNPTPATERRAWCAGRACDSRDPDHETLAVQFLQNSGE
jgi:hypothetical protein